MLSQQPNPKTAGARFQRCGGMLVFCFVMFWAGLLPAGEPGFWPQFSPPERWFGPSRSPQAYDENAEAAEFSAWGSGNIKIEDPAEYPHVTSLDNSNRNSLFDTLRPNLLGRDVPPEWDFYNLINTDRPDFTDATFTVGKGVTIWESGYTFRRTNAPDTTLNRRQLPEVLLRYGLTDEFELRIKWNGYIITDQTDKPTGMKAMQAGGDDLILGFKYEIRQQQDWIPMLTFVSGATVPTGTNGVSANQTQPYVNLVYGWGLRRWLYLKGSTGVDFLKSSDSTRVISGSLEGGPFIAATRENVTEWHQSLSLLYQASPRVGGFMEWFSFFSKNAEDNTASHFLDTGLFIYATPNVQFDVRIGKRLSNRDDTFFTGAGFSVRY
jgi:hypothetical protein